MPIVDLDDELSIVAEEEETLERTEVDDSVYSGMKSDMSAMEDMSAMDSGLESRTNSEDERERQQWIIDSILHHQAESPSPANAAPVSESETDDDSLYLDNSDEKKSTPKTKNARKKEKHAPSPTDRDYQHYMDVSGIVDNFGEEEKKEGWRKKVLGKNKKAQDPKESKSKRAFGRNNSDSKSEEDKPIKGPFGRKSTSGSDKSEEAAKPTEPKENWRKKNPFRGKNDKNPTTLGKQEQLASDPYETNLAPLGNIDDVNANEDTNKNEGWMAKVSFLGKNKAEEQPRNDDFEEHYAANLAPKANDDFEEHYAAELAPLGAVQDVEANNFEDDNKLDAPQESSWSSRMMTSLIGNITDTKPEPVDEMAEPKESLDDEKSTTSSIGLTESIALADDIVAAFATTDIKVEETEEHDEEKGMVPEELEDYVTDEETKVEIVEETEGKFIGSAENDANEEASDDMVVAWVGNNDQTEANAGSGDKTEAKKTWKSKVKSVRKNSTNKLSTLRKSSKSKLSKKSFTQDKMKAMEATADDNKTVESKRTVNSNSSLESDKTTGGFMGGLSHQRKKTVGIVMLCIVFTAIIIGSVVGSMKRVGSDDTPTEVPPEQVEYLYKLLYPISGDALTVEDPESPLVKSFVWVADDSTVRPDDTDDEIILRYCSAVVYYSLGGESWTKQNNFLSHDDLCKWNDADTSGIICSGSQIHELKLGTYETSAIWNVLQMMLAHVPCFFTHSGQQLVWQDSQRD